MKISENIHEKTYSDIVLTPFTKREYQVFELYALGKKTKEIAAMLFLAESTVKTHRENILQKLNINREKLQLDVALCWVWQVFGNDIKANIKGVLK